MAWWDHAKAGDLLVCINLAAGYPPDDQLRIGNVYTLREIHFYHEGHIDFDPSNPGVLVEEIVNPIDSYDGLEEAYDALDFRPVQNLPASLTELQTRTTPVMGKENEHV